MPTPRSPLRDKAFESWQASGRMKPLKDIAADLGVSEGQVRKWKSVDKWDSVPALPLPIRKKNVTVARLPPANERKALEAAELDNADLKEKQRLFCLYFLRDFNATHAAIKAGYSPDSAAQQGCELLKNPKVAAEIRRLKDRARVELFIDATDILDKYARIAFADTTQYVRFGQRDVPVMGAFGPVKDEDGNILMHTVNYIDIAESTMVDGSILDEVSQGKGGIKVKLSDRMKALEKLERFFDLLPDKWKRMLDEKRLEIQREELNLRKKQEW